MKTSTQLKALVRNLSSQKNVSAEIVLRNYMIERFLERISVSEYRDSFILKGGVLIAAMVGLETRTTMDLDATITGQTMTESMVWAFVQKIIEIPLDDNVMFAFVGIEEIREEADYPGFRISIDCTFDKTKQMLKIDLTTGDSITPGAIEYGFPMMFESRDIPVMAYRVETILAEKVETVITRGILNTRMRDFYDIYLLTSLHAYDMDAFEAALAKTTSQRKTVAQMSAPEIVVDTLHDSLEMQTLWRRYQKRYVYASSVEWESAIEALRKLIKAI